MGLPGIGRLLVACTLLAGLPAAAQSGVGGEKPRRASYPSLSLPIVAGKVSAEVQSVLGLPDSCGVYRNWPRCSFQGGVVRIVFVNQRADWIEYHPQIQVPFAPDALKIIGLPVSKPTKSQPTQLVWEEIPGYREVVLTADQATGIPVFTVKWRTQ